MPRQLKRFQWLEKEIKRKGFRLGAELGTRKGRTAGWLLRACSELFLVVVDTWQEMPDVVDCPGAKEQDRRFRYFKRTVGPYRDRLTILQMRTDEAHTQVADSSLDFIFIDADHAKESVKKDIQLWEPKVRLGGMISGHDSHFPGVYEAVLEYYGDRVKFLPHDHCWAVTKTKELDHNG